MYRRAALVIVLVIASACTTGRDRSPAPVSLSSPRATPSDASPGTTLSQFGFPPVSVSPGHAPVGARISLEGDGFVGPDWRDVTRANADAGYGVFLIRDFPDGCELIAGARFNLRVDSAGHLTADMTVPDSGQCFQGERSGRVTPGRYRIGIGCHACEVANLNVTRRTTSFDACVGSPHGLCKNRALYLAGDRPHVLATISSGGEGATAILLRRAPGGTWQPIASVPVDESGHIGWQWVTTDQHARGGAWSFRYRIPGHGQSDVVRVSIVEPDF